MNKIYLSAFTLLAFVPFVFAGVTSFSVDLNKDKKNEVVQFEDGLNGGIVTVLSKDGDLVDKVAIPGHIRRVEAISLNKDNIKQILVWFETGDHYRSIAIYGLKDNELYEIFRNGSPTGIETNFESPLPSIRINIAKEANNMVYSMPEAKSNDWQIWFWNGKEFLQQQP